MDHFHIRIQMESDLSGEIWSNIEGDIISNLLNLSKIEKNSNNTRINEIVNFIFSDPIKYLSCYIIN